MSEVVLQLGPDRRVLAVLTPAAPQPENDSSTAVPPLGCILVNAGVIHRVGPHRINVKLARAMARQGVCSVRLDLSGRGDTPADMTSKRPLAQQSVHDIQLAMDALHQAYGCQRFVMFGICSGAVNATDAALVDERIVGICLMDGHAYTTGRSRRRHVLHYVRGRSPLTLARTVMRKLMARLSPANSQNNKPASVGNRGLGYLSKDAFENKVTTITGRGASVYAIYTGSVEEYFNYEGQFEDVFGHQAFHGRVRCDYIPQIDHTLTTVNNQHILIERFSAWCCQFRQARTDSNPSH